MKAIQRAEIGIKLQFLGESPDGNLGEISDLCAWKTIGQLGCHIVILVGLVGRRELRDSAF